MISNVKAFAVRGNVVDLAVGVIIGGAFGAIVTSKVRCTHNIYSHRHCSQALPNLYASTGLVKLT